MKKTISKDKILGVALFAIFMTILFAGDVFAGERSVRPSCTSYVIEDQDDFDISKGSKVSSMPFGKKTIGDFTLCGSIEKETTYNHQEAYGVSDSIALTYSYSGNYNKQNAEEWNVNNCLKVNYDIDSVRLIPPVAHGVVLFQKSEDGENWENAADPVYDAFGKDISSEPITYITESDDIKNGYYYRVIAAYQLVRKNGENFLKMSTYEYKDCVEIYEFYVASENNYIMVKDIENKKNLSQVSTVEHGFCIDKGGSEACVTVTKGSQSLGNAANYDSFVEPGEYTVNISTVLSKKYSYKITVSDGLTYVSLNPIVYESKKNSGFPIDNTVSNTIFNSNSYTSAGIAQGYGKSITKSSKDSIDSYGIYGSNVFVFLKLKYSLSLDNHGQEVVFDKWGKGKKELIEGVNVGQVGTGALIIQTSNDGVTWEAEDLGRYSNGLNTTDYGNFYCENEDTIIYTPSGNDVLNGLYIRVLYAYQVHDDETRTDKDYLEEYKFYLCSDELNAVTFHNLSVSDTVRENYGDTKENEVSIYSKAETLLPGSMTVKGFRIDTCQNPTVKYTVKKDGNIVIVPKNGVINQTGKYDVSLVSAVGTKKDITLYVDTEDSETSLNRYFGESFITGKRIFSEGKYPVYEAGLTSYNIKGQNGDFVPVSGTITNNTTGKVITIDASNSEKTKVLQEAGEYSAVLTTNTGTASGDRKEFTFRFALIAKGTAPGPVVNEDSLNEYCRTNISDSYPMYYGVTYQSASKGYITIAFADKDDAVNYARNYEKGMVEVQSDGSYRYNGSLNVSQKEKYDSNWDLTDAINYFAENAVTKYFFDMSDDFTYCTLKDSDISKTKNLRTLELARSVVVFGTGQKKILTGRNNLPVISAKSYLYLIPGTNGKTEQGKNDFEFVHDKYGCDSNSVVITDCSGKKFDIKYNEGVGNQLQKLGCSSGIVTITESTIYGDTNEYEAIFIRDEENTAEVSIAYYSNGKERSVKVSSGNVNIPDSVDAFSIEEITDPLDDYSLVTVTHDNMKYTGVSDQVLKEAWSIPGTYSIKIVNRVGNAFSFDVNVADSDYTAISFEGDGTEETKDIISYFNETNVQLPILERYGYEFDGYTDQNGDSYFDEILVVKSKSPIILTAKWTPKKSAVVIKNSKGNTLQTVMVDFGSKFRLKDAVLPENATVLSWESDGNEIEGDAITVSSENEMILTVLLDENLPQSETQPETNEIKESEDSPKETEGHAAIWIIIVVAVVACATLILIKKGKFDLKTGIKLIDKQATDDGKSPTEDDGDLNEEDDN